MDTCGSDQVCIHIDACEDSARLKSEIIVAIEANNFTEALGLQKLIENQTCTTQDDLSTMVCCNMNTTNLGEYICILYSMCVLKVCC